MSGHKENNEHATDPEIVIPENNEVIEEIELEELESNNASKLKQLREKLKKCTEEKSQHHENLQRAKAEFLNVRKRLEENQRKDAERAVNSHIQKLLPLADSFYMAMSDKTVWEAIDPEWRKGVESIHGQLHTILSGYNVTEVTPEGEDFDPNIHEAMTNIPVDSNKMNNKIISVLQNGFTRTIDGEEILIRPARVTVGEYAE